MKDFLKWLYFETLDASNFGIFFVGACTWTLSFFTLIFLGVSGVILFGPVMLLLYTMATYGFIYNYWKDNVRDKK